MTASRHLGNDVLADYLEGLLVGGNRVAVATHLAECESCAANRDRFADLRMVLGRAGATPPPMPPALATRLDAVLAAEVRDRSAADGPPRRSAAQVSPLSRARHRRRPSRIPRLFAAAASTAVLAAAGVAAYLVFGTGSFGPTGGPESRDTSAARSPETPLVAQTYAFKNGPADLTAEEFPRQVGALVGPGSPASKEPDIGIKGSDPGALPANSEHCVTQVLKTAKAGEVLDTRPGQLDGTPVSLAITSTRNAQVVRIHAVRGCPGMDATIVKTAEVRVR